MGRDKALLEIDGQPMALRVAEALLAAGATEVVAVGGDLQSLQAIGLEAVADRAPAHGPLGGVLTALDVGGPLVMVVACDLVAPSPDAMAEVVDALGADRAADVAVPVVDGRPQWVHAAWRSSAAGALRRSLAAGTLAIHRAVSDLEVVRVAGLESAALRDADEPGELPGARSSPSG
jgi:molybdenum cofactor guanylyltransferase